MTNKYLLELLEGTFGKKTTRWTVPDCGLSAAQRFSVQFEDGSSVFVKAATDGLTAQWLRAEHLVLSSVQSALMPYVIKWIDQPGNYPVLISQDLSQAYWPASHQGVTWREGDHSLLFRGVKALSTHAVPPGLRSLQNPATSSWAYIAKQPDAFLSLQLCSEEWFRQSVETLITAEKNVDITGDCLVHGDLRSDNICFSGTQVKFVDWSHAARGSSHHDQAMLLPSLFLEGGPEPYLVMPEGGSEAALISAGHIRRLITETSMPPWLQEVFKQLIVIELEWAAQCLELRMP